MFTFLDTFNKYVNLMWI